MRGLKSRLITAALLIALTTVTAGTTAAAAPPRIKDANLRTADPATTCVRGPGRPFIGTDHARLQAYVPSLSDSGALVSVQFRVINLSDGALVFSGESPMKSTETWHEPSTQPQLLNATSYAWQARVFDGAGYSPWSNRCEFSVDLVGPNAPGLTITPEGPYHVGQQIALHFTNAGSTDVVRYAYGFRDTPDTSVAACPGTATVTLTDFGPTTLMAWSYDRAGAQSPSTIVNISVNFQP
jgi:hypothetical protein